MCGCRLPERRANGALRVARRQRAAPVASAAFASGALPMLAQLAVPAAWTVVGVVALRVFMGDQQKQSEPGQQECSTCGGTGTVECWCSRWSDGDGGCSTCGGSKRMVCSSCRGGGTAVPIEARIQIRNERTDNYRQGRD